MAIGTPYAAGSATSKGTSITSIVVTLGAAIPVGDTVFVLVAGSNQELNSVYAATDSRGNAYAQARGASNISVNASGAILSAPCLTALQVGDTVTVTLPASADPVAVSVLGCNRATTVDQAAAAAQTTAASISASVTTTSASELVLALVAHRAESSGTPGGGFALLGVVGTSGGTAATNVRSMPMYRVVTTTGTYTPSMSGMTNGHTVIVVASFVEGAWSAPGTMTASGRMAGTGAAVAGRIQAEGSIIAGGSVGSVAGSVAAVMSGEGSLGASGTAGSVAGSVAGSIRSGAVMASGRMAATAGASAGAVRSGATLVAGRMAAVAGSQPGELIGVIGAILIGQIAGSTGVVRPVVVRGAVRLLVGRGAATGALRPGMFRNGLVIPETVERMAGPDWVAERWVAIEPLAVTRTGGPEILTVTRGPGGEPLGVSRMGGPGG